jgi:hypothetical protein
MEWFPSQPVRFHAYFFYLYCSQISLDSVTTILERMGDAGLTPADVVALLAS